MSSLCSTKHLGNEFDKIKSFIPSGYNVLDAVSGDLNGDSFTDYVLVLNNYNEDRNGEELRPLLLIMGSKNGQLNLRERNDSVVLCKNCGGFLGDPFQKLAINDGILTIDHNVGNRLRWGRTISFRYDRKADEFILDNDKKVFYERSKNQQFQSEAKKVEATKVVFSSYSFARESLN